MFRFATVMLGIGAYVHALALYALRMNSLLMKINNSVDNCNFILSIQVALKTLVSVIPFLLIFFAGAIGGKTPGPPLRTPLQHSTAAFVDCTNMLLKQSFNNIFIL